MNESIAAGDPHASVDLSTIVRAAVYPAIGVARVGNSTTDFFYGPEVAEPSPQPAGFYRDGNGALKRQAARFRVYGYDARGTVVAELTPAIASIGWTVQLANLKAAWYAFEQALDIPESKADGVFSPRRNVGITGAGRNQLAIDGGRIAIAGLGTSGPGYAFNGSFLGAGAYLGELRTDASGRLIVLGGLGKSFSPANAALTTFANNDGWCDDTSDGPVVASVTVQGRSIPCDPGWVVVAPPNYGPNLKSVRTMYDLLADLFHQRGTLSRPSNVSFQRDILPIFTRMSALQWTNEGFANAFGHGAPLNFADPTFLAWASVPLRMPVDVYAERRIQIANGFRDVSRDGYSPTPLPWLYGDAISVPTPKTDNTFTQLTATQLDALQKWASGDFVGDYDPHASPPRSIDAVPLNDQPGMLDRAALEFCLADAFHPGCEITWPMRHDSMYMSPFRIQPANWNSTQPDYGDELTPDNILGASGPLAAQWPGGLTRWMAVPWQTDTASCLSGYVPAYDPYLPTFWPARVPNHVLDAPEYDVVMDTSLPRETRKIALRIRRSWPGVLPGADGLARMTAMVTLFPSMGIAEQRVGIAGDPDFPSVMQVTALPDFSSHGTAGVEAVMKPYPYAAHADSPRAPRGPGFSAHEDPTFMARFANRWRRKPTP